MPLKPARPSSGYWDETARNIQTGGTDRLWRAHSDAVNIGLFSRWLPASTGCLLKTDLFDESLNDGLLPLLEGRAAVVTGIDTSFQTAHAAHGRYRQLRGVVADVRRLPFADGGVACIVSNSTLDHFESRDDIVESLREMSRILRPGGHLLLTMDNRANPAIWLRSRLPFEWLNRLGIVPYYVGATCGPRRLRQYLQDAGLEVIETTAIMHCPRVLGVAMTRYLNHRVGERTRQRLLRFLLMFERLERSPIRYLTGYYIAMRTVKPCD